EIAGRVRHQADGQRSTTRVLHLTPLKEVSGGGRAGLKLVADEATALVIADDRLVTEPEARRRGCWQAALTGTWFGRRYGCGAWHLAGLLGGDGGVGGANECDKAQRGRPETDSCGEYGHGW